MSRWSKEKLYTKAHKKLVDSKTSSHEQEQIILTLLNDQHNEAYLLLGEYLVSDEIIIPSRYIQNYKGEFLHSVRTLSPEHLARGISEGIDPKIIQNFLFDTLTKYYSYEELRDKIFSALTRLNLAQKGANHLLSIIWSEAPPITIAKEILFQMIDYVEDNVQSNHLYWFLFTPSNYLTQDFPGVLHFDIFEQLLTIHNEYQAILMLLQAMVAELNKNITNWDQYIGNYLKPFNEDAMAILLSQKKSNSNSSK